MGGVPPSGTWFTNDPHWGWWIVLYFFMGAIASGAFLTAALVDLVGGEADRQFARTGYLIAFPLTLLDALFLTLDLGRPERFTHLLWGIEVGRPIVKPWSPISFGSWAFLLFNVLTGIAFVRELVRRGWLPIPPLVSLNRVLTGTVIDRLFIVLCALFGLVLATYPGVLLNGGNRPLWGDTALLGALFVASAAALGAASLVLVNALTRLRGAGTTLAKMTRFTQLTLGLSLVVLVALVLTAPGPVLALWASVWGALIALGVVLLVVGLGLGYGSRTLGTATPALAALVILVGGLLMRITIVLSNEGVRATAALLGR